MVLEKQDLVQTLKEDILRKFIEFLLKNLYQCQIMLALNQ